MVFSHNEEHNMNFTDKEIKDVRLAHLSFDAKMEEMYNEAPTFEETLDELWNGNLEFESEDEE